MSDGQMDALAQLADRVSFRHATHHSRPEPGARDVPQSALPEVWRELDALGLANPQYRHVTDMICCRG